MLITFGATALQFEVVSDSVCLISLFFLGENSNGDFNNVALYSVFQFSDEGQGLKY